ncbi:MAG: alcohol dehydrogenase catalytic domain-containing protein [Gammaproteobacteria bacterium]|nr:alcohol dehydrogenase catalytic domain-containing protein [Gammaproteobacteria bacterium]
MRALWIENRHISFKENLPLPEPAIGEALIRPRLAGICGTDIQLSKDYYEFCGIPGHEFVGEVIDAPENEEWTGRRVVGEINISCEKCAMCLQGLNRHCEQRRVLGIRNQAGVFAERFVLPIRNLHVVPDTIDDADAVYVEPLAAILRIREQVNIEKQTSVLIIGAGKLGLLAALALKQYSNNICVIAFYEYQRQLLSRIGVEYLEHLRENRQLWDVVIDVTGSPSGFNDALSAVRPQGSVVVKSTYADTIKTHLSRIVVDEISIIGSRCGPFAPALELLSQGLKPLLLTHSVFEFENAIEAFRCAQKKGVTKVIIDFARLEWNFTQRL